MAARGVVTTEQAIPRREVVVLGQAPGDDGGEAGERPQRGQPARGLGSERQRIRELRRGPRAPREPLGKTERREIGWRACQQGLGRHGARRLAFDLERTQRCQRRRDVFGRHHRSRPEPPQALGDEALRRQRLAREAVEARRVLVAAGTLLGDLRGPHEMRGARLGVRGVARERLQLRAQGVVVPQELERRDDRAGQRGITGAAFTCCFQCLQRAERCTEALRVHGCFGQGEREPDGPPLLHRGAGRERARY